jgi:hypothetical protein
MNMFFKASARVLVQGLAAGAAAWLVLAAIAYLTSGVATAARGPFYGAWIEALIVIARGLVRGGNRKNG